MLQNGSKMVKTSTHFYCLFTIDDLFSTVIAKIVLNEKEKKSSCKSISFEIQPIVCVLPFLNYKKTSYHIVVCDFRTVIAVIATFV